MATARNVDIILGKYNVIEICANENYTYEWVAN
jgi:hypothetical protein